MVIKQDPKINISIEDVLPEDVLELHVRVNEGDIRSRIAIESWFRDYLRKHDDDRQEFVRETLKAINKAIDEEGVSYVG